MFIKRRFTIDSEWITGENFSLSFKLIAGIAYASDYTVLLIDSLTSSVLKTYIIAPVGDQITWSPVIADLEGLEVVRFEVTPTVLTAANAVHFSGIIRVVTGADVQNLDAQIEVSGSHIEAQEIVFSSGRYASQTPVAFKPVITPVDPNNLELTADDGTRWRLSVSTGGEAFFDPVETVPPGA